MPSVNYSDYDPDTGVIHYTAQVNSGKVPPVPDNLARVYQASNPDNQYINEHYQVADRSEFNVMVSRSGNAVLLSNIPTGTKVMAFGDGYIVDDGEFELSLDQPADIPFQLINPRYITKVFTVESE